MNLNLNIVDCTLIAVIFIVGLLVASLRPGRHAKLLVHIPYKVTICFANSVDCYINSMDYCRFFSCWEMETKLSLK